jgi:hypothetical protein
LPPGFVRIIMRKRTGSRTVFLTDDFLRYRRPALALVELIVLLVVKVLLVLMVIVLVQ